MRLAVLASGRGSNLRALIGAHDQGVLASRVAGVFSDRPGCAAIAFAAGRGIATFAAKPSTFDSREAYDRALFDRIAAIQPDLIICAGYMRLISASAVTRFEGRVINIHPSLLPAYPGLDTHARALAAGERVHGASVHLVIPALDAGPVIAQARLPVQPGETASALADRVLEREHSLLVRCVQAMESGTLALVGGLIHWRGALLQQPLALNASDQLEESER